MKDPGTSFPRLLSCSCTSRAVAGPGEERCTHVVGELLRQEVSVPVSSQTERDQTKQAEGKVPGSPFSLSPCLLWWSGLEDNYRAEVFQAEEPLLLS